MSVANGPAPARKTRTVGGAYKTPRLSPWLMYPLAAIMLLYAVLPYMSLLAPPEVFEKEVEDMKHAPFLASVREPDGTVPAMYRLRDAPILYSTHIFSAIAWTVGIPLQHAAPIRRKYPAFHRGVGYVVFISSLLLGVGGWLFAPLGLAYSHPNIWHIHRPFPDQLPWLGWPTFAMSVNVLGPVQLSTAYYTIKYARSRDIALHQRWATIHTLAAAPYTLHLLFRPTSAKTKTV